MPLIEAQMARRSLDYLVGFQLSPLLWRKIKPGLSAGRVQSPALRMIVEREEEIEKFQSQEYWSINANLDKKRKKFSSKLIAFDNKKITKMSISNKEEAEKITNAIGNTPIDAKIIKITPKEKRETLLHLLLHQPYNKRQQES